MALITGSLTATSIRPFRLLTITKITLIPSLSLRSQAQVAAIRVTQDHIKMTMTTLARRSAAAGSYRMTSTIRYLMTRFWNGKRNSLPQKLSLRKKRKS